jgi:hypothetical protein
MMARGGKGVSRTVGGLFGKLGAPFFRRSRSARAAAVATGVRVREGLTGPLARNSLTNLRTSSPARLDDFRPGSAFAGVYDPGSRRFLAYPSGESKLRSGQMPENMVPRYGGHGDVSDIFSLFTTAGMDDIVGFTAILRSDGSIGMHWVSRSVNGLNRSFEGIEVPQSLRGPIMDLIQQTTYRQVWPNR